MDLLSKLVALALAILALFLLRTRRKKGTFTLKTKKIKDK